MTITDATHYIMIEGPYEIADDVPEWNVSICDDDGEPVESGPGRLTGYRYEHDAWKSAEKLSDRFDLEIVAE